MKKKKNYISINDKKAVDKLHNQLYELILSSDKQYKDIIFVCIGTDRSTGDSLAPMIGYNLKNKYKIYGTIHKPVHAKNLDDIINKIDVENNLIIAIDACLGDAESVGYIKINKGSIKPGCGVGKDLTPVGDIFIAGIVNFGGFMDMLVLNNTRLSVVISMSEIITKAINKTMKELKKDKLEKIA